MGHRDSGQPTQDHVLGNFQPSLRDYSSAHATQHSVLGYSQPELSKLARNPLVGPLSQLIPLGELGQHQIGSPIWDPLTNRMNRSSCAVIGEGARGGAERSGPAVNAIC